MNRDSVCFVGQKPEFGPGEGATIRAMLAKGESRAAAGGAVGVSTRAVSLWCQRERDAGRAVPIGKRPKKAAGGQAECTAARAVITSGAPAPPPPPAPEVEGASASTIETLNGVWGIATDANQPAGARVQAFRAHYEIAQEHARQPAAIDVADRVDSIFDALKDDPEPPAA